jgi:hypothetical protein
MAASTELVDLKSASPMKAVVFNDMDQILRGAELMAKAKHMVPDHFINNPGGCMAIIMQAQRWGMDPFVVAGKTHIVSGKLGYEAQLVNAVVQGSGMIVGSFKYEYRGDGPSLECRVGARLRGDQEVTWGEWLAQKDVQVKNSPLWKTNPRQQLGYLQVKNWARLYCPGAILGVYTPEELRESPAERDITPSADKEPQHSTSRTKALKEQLRSEEAPPEEAAPEGDNGNDEPAGAEQQPAEPLTYAQVCERINAAGDAEGMAGALEAVQEFLAVDGNEKFRDEIRAVYKARQDKLAAAGEEG